MSILIVELVPQGIIFGADRNISWTYPGQVKHIDNLEEGALFEQSHFHCYQSLRPKVLRWPKNKALIGYTAEDARIGGMATDEWLYEFIADHLNFASFADLAESLRRGVEEQRRIDEGSNEKAEPIIMHLGGFEEREGIQVPTVWVIRNDHNPPHLTDIRKEFTAEECFWGHQEMLMFDITPKHVQEVLTSMATKDNPFWFHQGFDLGTFNTLEKFLKAGLRELRLLRPVDLHGPQTLQDWERQVRMSILMYGAYFQAYKEPHEQFVGGGVDVVSIPWPE